MWLLILLKCQKTHLNRIAQDCYISVIITQDRSLYWKILDPNQQKQDKWKEITNSLILNWI